MSVSLKWRREGNKPSGHASSASLHHLQRLWHDDFCAPSGPGAPPRLLAGSPVNSNARFLAGVTEASLV